MKRVYAMLAAAGGGGRGGGGARMEIATIKQAVHKISSSNCVLVFMIFILQILLVPKISAFHASIVPQPPAPDVLVTTKFPCTSFPTSFANIWASDHQIVSQDQRSVSIMLDKSSGTGFRSKYTYLYGFFSAGIKLPANNYTAGVITTFYTSNAEVYPDIHDEMDFEFLGRIPGEEYILQTNVYGNGSTQTGREQRFRLWFDPTADFHDYSFLWTPDHVVFFVDDVPIREFPNLPELGGQFPAKPTYTYATIWDGSDWATDGGKYKANYSYAPFEASYTNLILSRCVSHDANPIRCYSGEAFPASNTIPTALTRKQKRSMEWVKSNYLTYDYCTDKQRYPTTLPECRPTCRPAHITDYNDEL